MKNKPTMLGMILLFAALILSACGSNKVERSVVMTEFKFSPDTIDVPAGKEVTLTLTNNGALNHNYIIMKKGAQATAPFDANDESNVYWKKELDRGQTETVTFTAPGDPGDYQVVCSTPGHLEQQMVGKLVVTQP